MYKKELKKELLDLIQRYFNEEVGNRLTSFNMNGFIFGVNAVFDNNEAPDSVDE
jgi:hypothetical protein